jgi:hypothetical protein
MFARKRNYIPDLARRVELEFKILETEYVISLCYHYTTRPLYSENEFRFLNESIICIFKGKSGSVPRIIFFYGEQYIGFNRKYLRH